ncbi:MAG TPA: CdaR family protein [Candidatus Binatia bacterium]|nr:CdaR family protein [Candidatus Binatia bacterium]
MQFIEKNFSLKLLALGLAIVGWAYFRFANSPTGAAAPDQQLSIPIAAVNLPLGYVAHFADHQAVVTVAAKGGEPAVKPEEIKAVLDLSNKGTGIYNVPVQLVAPDVVVQSLSPASITLTVEPIEQRPFPVTLHYVGARTGGIVVASGRVEPQTAVVRGPASVLGQVSAVQADVALPSAAGDVDEMVRAVAVNSGGTEVSGLSVAPNLVRVQMHSAAGTGKTK